MTMFFVFPPPRFTTLSGLLPSVPPPLRLFPSSLCPSQCLYTAASCHCSSRGRSLPWFFCARMCIPAITRALEFLEIVVFLAWCFYHYGLWTVFGSRQLGSLCCLAPPGLVFLPLSRGPEPPLVFLPPGMTLVPRISSCFLLDTCVIGRLP